MLRQWEILFSTRQINLPLSKRKSELVKYRAAEVARLLRDSSSWGISLLFRSRYSSVCKSHIIRTKIWIEDLLIRKLTSQRIRFPLLIHHHHHHHHLDTFPFQISLFSEWEKIRASRKMKSYQNSHEGGLSPLERPRSESLGHSLRNAAIVAAVLFGSAAIFSKNQSAGVAMDETSPMSMKQTTSLLGSSKPKPKVASNLMQLKGYPPYSVQQEYLDALSEINWKHVEKDIKDLLTDSKDCKFYCTM